MPRTPRWTRLAAVLAACACWSTAAAGPAGAQPASSLTDPVLPSIVHGTVSDARGPVAGALVMALPASGSGNRQIVTTGQDGSYQLWLPDGDWIVGATPPSGSADGYADASIAVPGTDLGVDLGLPPTKGTGDLTGTATYAADGSVAAGVDVVAVPLGVSGAEGPNARTDRSGAWSLNGLPAGAYDVSFSTVLADGSRSASTSRFSVSVGAGAHRTLQAALDGPVGVGFGRLTGRVVSAGRGVGYADVTLTAPGTGAIRGQAQTDMDGAYALELPAGAYAVKVDPQVQADATSVTGQAAVPAGEDAAADFTLPALSTTAGATAHHTAELLRHLNAERARWGLPAGVVANATWSQACASHDAYLQANDVLQHPEGPGERGYSPGGNWAGTSAILARGGQWTTDGASPWEDAPYHLEQMLAPDLVATGIDESGGFTCLTTFPGMLGPVAAPGTVFTYPGDGTAGFPPAEDAEELPGVPGEHVGLPEGTVAGRELFVYREKSVPPFGSCTGDCSVGAPPELASASLVGPHGPVKVRVVRGHVSQILIPVKPLEPMTRYTATVVLKAEPDFAQPLPAVTHTWSFTTGRANGSSGGRVDAPRGSRHRLHAAIALRRIGRRVLVTGRHWPRGHVVIHRGTARGHRLGTARVSRRGTFRTFVHLGSPRRRRITVTEGRLRFPAVVPAVRRTR